MQNLEYENKIKVIEADLPQLKNQMQEGKAIPGTEMTIPTQRICLDKTFCNSVKRMTGLKRKLKLIKLTKHFHQSRQLTTLHNVMEGTWRDQLKHNQFSDI